MKPSEFIQKCLSSSGEVSFGRTASLLSLVFCLGWDTAFVWFAMRHLNFERMSIHDVLPSATALAAQGVFCTLFYGINKTKGMLDNRAAKPEDKQ